MLAGVADRARGCGLARRNRPGAVGRVPPADRRRGPRRRCGAGILYRARQPAGFDFREFEVADGEHAPRLERLAGRDAGYPARPDLGKSRAEV